MLAFEMGYDWLGRMPYKGDNVNGAFKAQGVQLTAVAKLGYPVTDDPTCTPVWARHGMACMTPKATGIAGRRPDTGVSPVFAGGVSGQLPVTSLPVWNTSGVNNIGTVLAVGVRPDNGMLSWCFLPFRSAGRCASRSSSPAPASRSTDQEFHLKSDAPLNFNKATLENQKVSRHWISCTPS